jgi:hypothetical protein
VVTVLDLGEGVRMRIAIRNRVLPVFEVKHQSFDAFDNKVI